MNYTYENVKGIDKQIQILQNHLYRKLNWSNLELFGRVFKNRRKNSKQIIPEAYVGNGEYREVLTNDKVDAIMFFIEDDEHISQTGYQFKTKINLVVIANLKKLYANNDYREDHKCIQEVIELLQSACKQVLKIKKGVKASLNEFYNEDITFSNMEPYTCFSLEFELIYQLDC